VLSSDRHTDEKADRGSVTIPMIFAIGLIMVIVLQVANVIVFSYGKGAVRSALDEGTRVGSRAGGPPVCEQVARDVLDQLAAGLGQGVSITCIDNGVSIVATATVHFDGWLASIADYDAVLSASAAKENR